MADPFTLATAIMPVITLARKLVVDAPGAHREAADELRNLLRDLERLKSQMSQIHDKLHFLVVDTKDLALKKLLQEFVLSSSSDLIILIKAQ